MSQWVEAADEAEFIGADRKLVDLGGTQQIGLYKVNGEYLAISAWCSHQRAIMFSGDVHGCELECPLHGARFDLRTGKNLSLPAVRPVARYETKVENGKVFIKTGP